MTRGDAAGARSRAARRGALVFGIVAVFSAPVAAAAQSPGAPPITIPPAPLMPAGDGAPDHAAGQAPSQPAGQPLGQPVGQPTMRALLPATLQILHDSQGAGIVMSGVLAARAASALAVLQGVFAYSQAFDPIPALRLALADQDDRHAQALFTATVQNAPVTGIAVVSLDDAGGDVSVFYDRADGFAASFERMRQALATGGGATTVLSAIRLGDGNQVAIPRGWRLIGQGAGLIDLMGTQGEFVSLGAANPVHAQASPAMGNVLQGPCCDPVKALQAVYPQLNANAQHLGSPAQTLTQIVESQRTPAAGGGEAAFLLSRLTVGGRPYSYFARVEAIGGFTDPWTLVLSGVTAPQPLFAEEFPTLLQIWRSYSGNPPGFADHLAQALQAMPAARQMVRTASLARRTADYNASPDWGPVISALPKAGQAPIDDAAAQKIIDQLAADTGHPWRRVPPSELK